MAKFLAARAFATIAIALTAPLWITINVLGSPDNGVVFAGYVGSILMAGGYMAIGACISAVTKSQVIAFVVAAMICFLFTVSGSPIVLGFFAGWAPQPVLDTIASFSFLTHFNAISRGVIDLRDLLFFGSLIVCFLIANAIVVDMKKSG